MTSSKVTFLLLLAACQARQTPKAPASVLEQASVTLAAADGTLIKVAVELALTPAERAQGLMHRQAMDEHAGMLFLFPREQVQTFWMKDTLIPLDMIFIRADLSIAGIVENAEPLTLAGRGVGQPSQYVLEVNGGFGKRHGLAAGGLVKLENVPALPHN